MPENNPFAYLLPTPDVLKARREAEFEEQNKGRDFWVTQMGRAGMQLRNNLIEAGRALGPEDRRAMTVQGVMADAQKNLADMVKSGEMDPMDAQELAVKQAMSNFMSMGDFRAAQSLLPGLNSIRQYREDLSKLRSETAENISSARQSEAGAIKSLSEAEAVTTKLPFETDKLSAEARAALGSEAERLANARLRDRTDPNLRARSGGGDDSPLKSVQAKYEEQVIGGAGAISRLGQITELVLSNPGVSGDSAASLAAIMDQTRGAAALARQSADQFVGLNNQRVESAAQSRLNEAYNAKRKDLNIAVGEFKSLTMDLAYALARARDPGGRLSDADVENAIRIIGAAGDPQRMVSVMKGLADNTYKDLLRHRARGSFFRDAEVNLELDSEYERFNSIIESFSTKPEAPPAGPGKARSDEELLESFRKKKK